MKREITGIMLTLAFVGNLHAHESLLSYFADKPLEAYFSAIQSYSQQCERIPTDTVQKYLLDVINDELFNGINGNVINYFAISKEKKDDYWLLTFSSFDGVNYRLYLCSFDPSENVTLRRLLIGHSIDGTPRDVRYVIYGDTIELTHIYPYPDNEEALPYVAHHSYRLDKNLSLLWNKDYSERMEFAQTASEHMLGEVEFLSMFEEIDSLSQVFQIQAGVPEFTVNETEHLDWISPIIPISAFYKYLAFTNNAFQKDLTTGDNLTYYAVCKLKSELGWLLVYGHQNGIHDNVDLFLCFYSCQRKRVVSKLHIKSDSSKAPISSSVNNNNFCIRHNAPNTYLEMSRTKEIVFNIKCSDLLKGNLLLETSI